MESRWMGLIIALAAGVVGLIIGLHSLRALREMMRSGRSYTTYDWRRLFGRDTAYDRTDQPALFWITIFFNAFLTTIALCFPLAVVLMFVFPLVAIIFHWGR